MCPCDRNPAAGSGPARGHSGMNYTARLRSCPDPRRSPGLLHEPGESELGRPIDLCALAEAFRASGCTRGHSDGQEGPNSRARILARDSLAIGVLVQSIAQLMMQPFGSTGIGRRCQYRAVTGLRRERTSFGCSTLRIAGGSSTPTSLRQRGSWTVNDRLLAAAPPCTNEIPWLRPHFESIRRK